MALKKLINYYLFIYWAAYIATPCAGLEPATPGLEVLCAIQLRQQGI
jgi:hypothetical protein